MAWDQNPEILGPMYLDPLGTVCHAEGHLPQREA